MRYSLRSSHRYAFLKVIFTVLKYLSTTFLVFGNLGACPRLPSSVFQRQNMSSADQRRKCVSGWDSGRGHSARGCSKETRRTPIGVRRGSSNFYFYFVSFPHPLTLCKHSGVFLIWDFKAPAVIGKNRQKYWISQTWSSRICERLNKAHIWNCDQAKLS